MLEPYIMNLLAQILTSQVRAEIFRHLFDRQRASYHLRELQRRSKLAVGTMQKEIAHLMKLDLIVSKKDGNRLYFSANTEHPLYVDICNLVEKTAGVPQKLKKALEDLPSIECAFIFGSTAKEQTKAHSDIDLIIIGTVGLRALTVRFKPLSMEIGREINPHVYAVEGWKEKVAKKDHFLTTVLGEKRIFIIGDEDVLTRLG
jgi:predicted nucleotidyltransferase